MLRLRGGALTTAALTAILSNSQLFLHQDEPAEVQALQMHQLFTFFLKCTHVQARLNRVEAIRRSYEELTHFHAEEQQLQSELLQSFTQSCLLLN